MLQPCKREDQGVALQNPCKSQAGTAGGCLVPAPGVPIAKQTNKTRRLDALVSLVGRTLRHSDPASVNNVGSMEESALCPLVASECTAGTQERVHTHLLYGQKFRKDRWGAWVVLTTCLSFWGVKMKGGGWL